MAIRVYENVAFTKILTLTTDGITFRVQFYLKHVNFLQTPKNVPSVVDDGEVRVYERGICQNLHFDHRWYIFRGLSIEKAEEAYLCAAEGKCGKVAIVFQ